MIKLLIKKGEHTYSVKPDVGEAYSIIQQVVCDLDGNGINSELSIKGKDYSNYILDLQFKDRG